MRKRVSQTFFERRQTHDDLLDVQLQKRIKRVNTLIQVGRNNWFALLGYIAFSGISLLAVEDADFFLDSRRTDLPLVGITIPTRLFFLFGPLLGSALYVYLHLYLLKLWEELAALPAKPYGEQLSLQISPWLVADFGLWLRRDDACRSRPMDWLAHIFTFLLAFLSGPILIGYFWMRYWPAHETLYSLGNGALFALMVMTCLTSFYTAITRLRWGHVYKGGWWHLISLFPALLIFVPIVVLTIVRTDGPDRLGASREFVEHLTRMLGIPFTISQANLREAVFVDLPPDWQPFETHKRRFRFEWCRRKGLDPELCGPPSLSDDPPASHLVRVRSMWCKDGRYVEDDGDCEAYFATLEERFLIDWISERRTRLAALGSWSPRNNDLRSADMTAAVLQSSDLRDAQMQGAILNGANLEGVDLRGANLAEAHLADARLELAQITCEIEPFRYPECKNSPTNLFRAVLQNAQLESAEMTMATLTYADLRKALLPNTNLKYADLVWADLTDAHLEHADLQGAKLQWSFFESARMQGAVLEDTSLLWTDFSYADLRDTVWDPTSNSTALAIGANFGGATLSQAGLAGVVGSKLTLLPNMHADEHLFVTDCWPRGYPGVTNLYAATRRWKVSEDEIRERRIPWFCPGRVPKKTGTSVPADIVLPKVKQTQ